MKIREIVVKDLEQLLKLLHRADTVSVLPGRMNKQIDERRRQGVYVRVATGREVKAFFVGVDSVEDVIVVEYMGDNTSSLTVPIIQ